MPRDLQKKSPGLLEFFSPGTMGPSEFLGPVLSRPVPGPSRDFPGRDSPAGKPSPGGKPKSRKKSVQLGHVTAHLATQCTYKNSKLLVLIMYCTVLV